MPTTLVNCQCTRGPRASRRVPLANSRAPRTSLRACERVSIRARQDKPQTAHRRGSTLLEDEGRPSKPSAIIRISLRITPRTCSSTPARSKSPQFLPQSPSPSIHHTKATTRAKTIAPFNSKCTRINTRGVLPERPTRARKVHLQPHQEIE